MLLPSPHDWAAGQNLGDHLTARGISRRDFLEFCGKLGAILGAGSLIGPEIAAALQSQQRPSVIWLQLQECTGCVESVLRSAEPTIGDLVLDVLSLDYQHTIMAAAGHAAESARKAAMDANKGKYLLVVTGSVPTKENGIYTTIGGRTARDILEEAAGGAAAVIALGACAHWGSVQAARPNPTGAVGVREIVTDKPVVNIAGCPPIADVVTATVAHYLTFNRLPELDGEGRPLFAYGARIHDQCPRRANFDAGQFVSSFDDEAARKGWCLYRVGCKGPATFSPCPIFQWNDGTSWPIGAGHPCIGCTEPMFWDAYSPFYERLPNVAGLGFSGKVDTIGAALAVGVLGGIAAHATATAVHTYRRKQLPIVPAPTEDKSLIAAGSGEEVKHGQD